MKGCDFQVHTPSTSTSPPPLPPTASSTTTCLPAWKRRPPWPSRGLIALAAPNSPYTRKRTRHQRHSPQSSARPRPRRHPMRLPHVAMSTQALRRRPVAVSTTPDRRPTAIRRSDCSNPRSPGKGRVNKWNATPPKRAEAVGAYLGNIAADARLGPETKGGRAIVGGGGRGERGERED